MPACSLDPRIKNVWRINDALWIVVIALVVMIPTFILASIDGFRGGWSLALIIEGVVFVAALVVWLVVLPPIRYMRWRYQISPEYLDIAKGIIWRKRYIVPFIRVQNTDTRQGPILRAFGLGSVTVATAAQEHEIPGLDMAVAEELRDKAAELARLAREDV